MSEILADKLKNDPRVQEAKELLLNALKEAQEGFDGPCPSNPDLVEQYSDLIEEMAKNRGGRLFFPYLGSGIGKGALVELADGSVKYDMICGIGPHYWGHSNPEVISAEIDACLSDLVMQGHLQQNTDSAELCAMLTNASGKDHCFLTTTGVMANENALKVAFHNKQPAYRVLAFEKCFAGRTLAFSQITDKPGYRDGLPSTLHVDYIPFYDEKDPKGSTRSAVSKLKTYLERYPGQYAAMIFELVQGEAGFYPGDSEFFIALMKLLKEHNVAIIDDEVQAFGRTHSLFAFQHFKLENYVDIVTIGKNSQVCATLFDTAWKPKPGLLSQTFIASTSAIRAAKVIIGKLINDGYLGPKGKIANIHSYFVQKFEGIAERHPGLLSGPYGIGSMIAFTPLCGSSEMGIKTLRALYDNGVIAFIAGSNPTRIRFLAPVGAITETDIDAVMQIVEQTLLECREGGVCAPIGD